MTNQTFEKIDLLARLQHDGHELALTLSSTEPWPQVMAEVARLLQAHDDNSETAEVVVELGERPVPKYEMASLVALLNRRGLRLQGVQSSSHTTQQSAAALSLIGATAPFPRGNPDSNRVSYPGAQLPLIPEQAGVPALYIPKSVISSGRVFSRGQLVVAGDVEEGAQVMAIGDILIWGQLKGHAHAGLDNNPGATIRALAISSEQIYINDCRFDSSICSEVLGPCELRISDGQVDVFPWQEVSITNK